jgi:two-component system, response regulator YesN
LSVSRFQHLFKKEIGVSFTQYVKQQRLRKARKLLEATHLRIKEIRAQIGECNEKKFLQNFKKTYGVTPTEYRKNFHNNRKSQ